MDWLYNTDFEKMDAYTFNLVNKVFFNNKKISTPQELQYFVDRTGEFYALRTVLKTLGTDVEKLMQKTKTEEEFVQLLDIMKSYPELYEQYTKLTYEFNIEVIEGAKKELLEKETIKKLNIQSNETLWLLRFTSNNYSIKDIIGYEDENLQVINQTLEYINHEN